MISSGADQLITVSEINSHKPGAGASGTNAQQTAPAARRFGSTQPLALVSHQRLESLDVRRRQLAHHQRQLH